MSTDPQDQPDVLEDPMALARNRALRLLLAHARGEHNDLAAVIDEAAADRPLGVPGLIMALADISNANAAALSPADWVAQLELLAIAEDAL